MDVTKVKAAIEAVRAEIIKVRDIAIQTASAKGAKPEALLQLNGIQELGKADANLDKVVARLEKAVERTTPKVKEAPAADAPKTDTKKK